MIDCITCPYRLKALQRDQLFGCPCYHVENEYYPIGIVEAFFCRHHVIWMLACLEDLAEGKWPPKLTGYVAQPNHTHEEPVAAPFERVTQVYSMLTEKLDATGDDGKALLAEIQEGLKWPSSWQALRALNYISGPELPTITYEDWLFKREYSEAEFIAEVKSRKLTPGLRARLLHTGDAGEVLLHEISSGLDSRDKLSDLARQAMDYCLKHRKQLFAQWRRGKNIKNDVLKSVIAKT